MSPKQRLWEAAETSLSLGVRLHLKSLSMMRYNLPLLTTVTTQNLGRDKLFRRGLSAFTADDNRSVLHSEFQIWKQLLCGPTRQHICSVPSAATVTCERSRLHECWMQGNGLSLDTCDIVLGNQILKQDGHASAQYHVCTSCCQDRCADPQLSSLT